MQNPGSTRDRHDLFAAELADHYLIEEELGRGGSATVSLRSRLRAPGRLRLTLRRPDSYIGLMRPETRRNRNPLSLDHAFT